ncbi:MAG TPA: Clp protease N-terminal domain-containing protein [Phototrophicaceae bacterium]|nr:Clp protease N-terminal domain-containing protein [Phototrophicaceae bacterium]
MSRVERFTKRAQRILVAAQEEAANLRNATVETPHLLLGMLRVEDSVAYRVLNDLRIDYDRVLNVVRQAHPAEPTPPQSQELAPETKRLLESALQIARQRGDQFIGSEHLLLSLVKGEDKSIRHLMRQINLEPQVVRSCVERVLQEDKGDNLPATKPFVQETIAMEEPEPPVNAAPSEPNPRTKVLQLVEAGKISASEAAELLKAMRLASLPLPGNSGFVLLPLDEVNFDDLRQRGLRFTIISKGGKSEVTIPFEQAQSELFRLLRSAYGGGQGKLIDLDGGQDRLQISLD